MLIDKSWSLHLALKDGIIDTGFLPRFAPCTITYPYGNFLAKRKRRGKDIDETPLVFPSLPQAGLQHICTEDLAVNIWNI